MKIDPLQTLNFNPEQFGDVQYEPLREMLTRISTNSPAPGAVPGGAVPGVAPPAAVPGAIPGATSQPWQPQPMAPPPEQLSQPKMYFKGIPVPLSQNNPFLAYLPKPGKGMIVTQKFIQDAINWENGEQGRQDIEDNRGRMASIVLKSLSEAAGNPDIMSGNRDMINYYGGLTDLIKMPGGEAIANNILASLGSMYSAKPEQIDPKKLAEIEKINSETELNKKKLGQIGLENTKEAKEDLIKKYNAVMSEYDDYVKSIDIYNKGIIDPEKKLKPLKPDGWLKQPGREGSLSIYNQVTGNKIKSLEVPFSNKTKKQVETEKRVKGYISKHKGVARAMKALWENIPQEEMQMLLDRYNKNMKTNYTLKRFHEKFIK